MNFSVRNLSAFGLLLFTAAHGATAPALTGDQILRKMVEAYVAVTSYQDTGVVLSHRPDKEQPDEILFRTWFVRPEALRFEWTKHHPYPPLRHVISNYTIWSDASGSHLLAHGKQNSGTVSRMVAGGTGVSRGASHHVTCLLMPTMGGRSLSDLADVRLLGEESFEGAPCYRLAGRLTDSCELWVGTRDFLIRRIVRDLVGYPTEEIRRDIQTDHAIPAEVISTPPQG